jgi:hypothetical protein
MDRRRKVGFVTKLLSNHYYLSEVPVEGKTTNKFYRKLGYNEHYVAQIIRTGNCITLLSTHTPITDDSFWNINYFEDLAKYIFWTFNKSFFLKVTDKVESLKLAVLQRCLELLQENFTSYSETSSGNMDEELEWCLVKNANLKKDPKFSQMYLLDDENRTVILRAIEKRIAEFPKTVVINQAAEESLDEIPGTSRTTLFLEVLRPMNGSPEETLKFMMRKTEEAGFEFNIFFPVPRLDNGKNPYGLNGSMGGMIEFFYQLNYFKKEYSFEEILKAYLQYSGNSIGKLKTFLSEFRQDKSFIKYTDKLKALKVERLS